MIRQTLKQIWTLRRRNAWIFAEMLIIFILSSILFDYFFTLVHNRLLPDGFDDSDTYMVTTIDLNRAMNGEGQEEHDAVVTKMRAFPGILHVMETSDFALSPHVGSYNGGMISRDSTDVEEHHLQFKRVDNKEYFDIFITPSVITGKPAHLDLSDNRQCILTEGIAKKLFGDEYPIGKTVFFRRYYRVVDIVRDQKRMPYIEPSEVIFIPATIPQPKIPLVSIRVGDNFDIERFKVEVTPSIQTPKEIHDAMALSFGSLTEERIRMGIMVFMLCNVALSVIGTFWFRNQKRRSEIGLRMALGSSRRKVQAQFIIEALLILCLAAIPALLINIGICQADIVQNDLLGEESIHYITGNKWWRFIIANTLTLILLGAITALSAWIPAHKAAALNPVDALRNE